MSSLMANLVRTGLPGAEHIHLDKRGWRQELLWCLYLSLTVLCPPVNTLDNLPEINSGTSSWWTRGQSKLLPICRDQGHLASGPGQSPTSKEVSQPACSAGRAKPHVVCSGDNQPTATSRKQWTPLQFRESQNSDLTTNRRGSVYQLHSHQVVDYLGLFFGSSVQILPFFTPTLLNFSQYHPNHAAQKHQNLQTESLWWPT